MVLTSPNMDYVPEYPVESTVIDMYADGRWGDHEYSRWPQVLQPDMWHVPCIPCVPVPPEVPEILWETLLPQSHWVEDRAIGFTGVGYIKTETRDALIAAANSAIQQCEEMGAPQRVAKYGRFLVMILRQVVDRMRYYPVVAEIAVAVAAHVQHVCLELAGLKTYIDVVAPRLASDRDHPTVTIVPTFCLSWALSLTMEQMHKTSFVWDCQPGFYVPSLLISPSGEWSNVGLLLTFT